MTITDTLAGVKVLEVTHSPVSGKLTVVKDLAWGTHILAGGLTQSGGIAELIWKKTLRKVASDKRQVTSVLILGLGGGGIAKLVRKNWPNAKIVGVDIDPVIVDLGKKYMKLDDYGVEIVIGDALEYVKSKIKGQKSKTTPPTIHHTPLTGFDIVCIDMYVGDEYPKKFTKKSFFRDVKRLLNPNGVAIFNRLYYGNKRVEAVKFGQDLEKVYKSVVAFAPEANIMFLCRN